MADDQTPIADDDFLIRKIEADPHLHDDGKGGRRISKAAFSPSSAATDAEKSMSCNSEALMQQEGLQPTDLSPATPVLARLSVKALRDLGLRVEHRELNGNASHCGVFDLKSSHRQKLLDMCELIRCPDDVHK